MIRIAVPVSVLIAVALAALPASAHSFGVDDASLSHGFGHPLGGLDHMLAMLGVGIWAWQSRGQSRRQSGQALWTLPAAFVAAMAVGGIAGFAGLRVAGLEWGIAGSVLLLSFLIALAPRLPLALSAGLVGLFALCHGLAHGAEAPDAASPALYALGFLVATAMLHGLGIGLAGLSARFLGSNFLKLAGMAIAAVGLGLFNAAS